jgi:hypothetical protein
MDELEQALIEGRPAPTVIGEHEFALDLDEAESINDMFEVWRWLCSCGERGNWQVVSGNAAYHAWLRHCGVPHDYTGEGS